MRLLTEFLLFIGVTAPPGLAVARFTGIAVPRFLGTDVVLGLSTAALLVAFIMASYMHPAKPARSKRRANRAPKLTPSLMLPAPEAFVLTAPRIRPRRGLLSARRKGFRPA